MTEESVDTTTLVHYYGHKMTHSLHHSHNFNTSLQFSTKSTFQHTHTLTGYSHMHINLLAST